MFAEDRSDEGAEKGKVVRQGVRWTISPVRQCCRGSGSSSHVMSVPVLLDSGSQLQPLEYDCLVVAVSHLCQSPYTLRPFEIFTYKNTAVQHDSSI
jgi:hypothetical protein